LRVKLFGSLRSVIDGQTGRNAVEATGDTVGEVLQELCTRYPGLRDAIFHGHDLGPHIRVMINGRDIALLSGLETAVGENDQIAIFPPIAGGLAWLTRKSSKESQ
jgi:molybdopterin synthase sulfur carrier subunit